LSAVARRAKAEATKQSISPHAALRRGACHRARIRATRRLAMTMWREKARQIDPTGKSLRIGRNRQAPKSKIFRFFRTANRAISTPIPSRQEGRIMIVTNVGRGAVDAGSADNERRESVRRSRVVLTPRCWRQVCGSSPVDDGGKKAGHQGELEVSRKAIAQGMSDVLRCPVCSCAHFLCTLRMRPRVQRASGIPCALFVWRGREITCKPRAQCAARLRIHIHHERDTTHYPRHPEVRASSASLEG
jgi:hypothetical protein